MPTPIIHDLPTIEVYTAFAGQQDFPFNFDAFDGKAVLVTVNGAPLVQVGAALFAGQYDVTIGLLGGGNVHTGVGLSAGSKVVVFRALPLARGNQLPEAGPVSMASINREFNRVVALMQDMRSIIARGILTPVGETAAILPPAADRVGRALVGLPDGSIGTAALGANNDPGLRSDIGNAAAGGRLMAYRQRSAFAKLEELVNPFDTGAIGNGVANDFAALQAALDAGCSQLPPGRFYIGANKLRPKNGASIRGFGKAAWEPYLGGTSPFPTIDRTVIIIDAGGVGFDLTGLNSVKVEGVTVRARLGTQSSYGGTPGFVANTIGFDITSGSALELIDVAMMGLASGIAANQTDGLAVCQMPHISRMMASDCDRVIRFGNSASTVYTVRDPRIDGSVIALHCNQMIEAHWCDGLRFEVSRMYQCKVSSIYLRKCNFVQMVGVCLFESTIDALVIDGCEAITMSGMQIARTGSYAATLPYAQRAGLRITNSIAISYEGLIEKVTGQPVIISGSEGCRISGTINTPFWTTGNQGSGTGVVTITTSPSTSIDIAISGVGYNSGNSEMAVYIAVWADAASERTLAGRVACPEGMGFVRAYHLTQRGCSTTRLDADTGIGAGGQVLFRSFREFIPAGMKMKTRSIQTTSPTVIARMGGVFWNAALTAEPGGGQLMLDNKVVYDNTAGPDGWYSWDMFLTNPSAGAVTVPKGHETRISFAVVG